MPHDQLLLGLGAVHTGTFSGVAVTFVAKEVACLHHGILLLQMVPGTVLVAPLVARWV